MKETAVLNAIAAIRENLNKLESGIKANWSNIPEPEKFAMGICLDANATETENLAYAANWNIAAA